MRRDEHLLTTMIHFFLSQCKFFFKSHKGRTNQKVRDKENTPYLKTITVQLQSPIKHTQTQTSILKHLQPLKKQHPTPSYENINNIRNLKHHSNKTLMITNINKKLHKEPVQEHYFFVKINENHPFKVLNNVMPSMLYLIKVIKMNESRKTTSHLINMRGYTYLRCMYVLESHYLLDA